jgi:Mg-chelatase subunit ChlD
MRGRGRRLQPGQARGHRGDGRSTRTAPTAIAGAIAGAGLLLMLAPIQAQAAPADVTPTSVAVSLGAASVPAEIVVLIDVSQSMSGRNGGLYPEVKRDLPRFLSGLARHDPQDTVAVVVFGPRTATQTIYLGKPTSTVPLPADATRSGTDVGYAFEHAIDILKEAPSAIKVGGVLLLSDGNLFAPHDPEYGGGRSYTAPGWRKLRQAVKGLSMTVTGYGLPLSESQAHIANVRDALDHVFAQSQTLAPDLTDLGAELGLARQRILASRVRRAARLNSGRGVQVTWVGLPGTAGAPALDLGSGSADVTVRLADRAPRVPLTVSGLSVTSSGLPVTISGTFAHARQKLLPGQPVTMSLHLTWIPVSGGSSFLGGTDQAHGRLILNGRVTSSFTRIIRDAYGDSKFVAGDLVGSASGPLLAEIPIAAQVGGALVALLVLALLAAVLGGLGLFRARLSGTLVLTAVGQPPGFVELAGWRPRVSRPTDQLIGKRGRVTVRGTVLAPKTMRVRVRIAGGQSGTRSLRRRGRALIAGIDVVHNAPGDQPPPGPATSAASSVTEEWRSWPGV